jgi:hypothetical protein
MLLADNILCYQLLSYFFLENFTHSCRCAVLQIKYSYLCYFCTMFTEAVKISVETVQDRHDLTVIVMTKTVT